jgi:UPF0755 protein
MTSNWPPEGGAGSSTGGYDADDFGVDPDYPADGGHYGNGADQGGYGWQSATQSYGHPEADQDSSGYGIAAYEGDPRNQASQELAPYSPPGRPDAYGQGSYRQDAYGQGTYTQDSYSQNAYGQNAYGQNAYGQDTYSQNGYDQNGYDQNGYAADSYGRPTQGTASYHQAPYSETPYRETPYGDQPAVGGAYGQSGQRELSSGQGGDYALEGPGQDSAPQNGYGRSYPSDGYDNGYGYGGNGQPARSEPPDDRGDYRHSDYGEQAGGPNPYGHDLYAQEGYNSARSYQELQDPDATSAYQGPSTGSFARPEAGSYDEPDSLAFPRPEPGSFGQADTGAYGRSSSFQGGDRASGYEPWHDADEDGDGWEGDESDGDWHDEGDSNLLSSRFGGDEGDDVQDTGRHGSRRRRKKTKRPRRARGPVALLASILAAALVVGAIGEFGYHKYEAWHTSRYGDYSGLGTGKVDFTVPQNAALSELGSALVKAGVIEEVRPFESAANAANGASTLQPGVYVLRHHMSSANAVAYLLSSAHRLSDAVTIIEGMRASKIAQILSAKTHIPVSQFTQLIDHPSELGVPSWASGAKTAEGFLFPDTYDILPNESALKILRTMVTEFNQQVSAINLVSEAKKVNTDAWHVLIVASLVQAEAGSPSNFGPIARVAWNRYAMKWPLEFDSTVFYAMGTYGTAITKAQESYKSPYNTYANVGLPPGPIGNPGIAAIQATLHPPHGNWLYFITDTRHKPYITHFTNSLSQLQQWQAEFGN